MTFLRSHVFLGTTTTLFALAAVALTGCTSAPESPTPRPAATDFDPSLAVDLTATDTVEIAALGGRISFDIPYPIPEVTGVDTQVAETFAAAVAGKVNTVAERAAGLEGVTVDGCDGGCDREAVLTIEQAGIYQQYGTVTSTTTWTFGARDRNAVISSVTMDLKTGQEAALSEFLDPSEPEAVARAEATISSSENGASCNAADHLAAVDGFAPTTEGLLLL